MTGQLKAETFTAVPVSGWGKEYIIVTLRTDVSVVIVNNDVPNHVMFTLMASEDDFEILIGKKYYKSGKHIKIFLARFGSYAISNCGSNTPQAYITGSSLKGHTPFGVVSGNCYGMTKTLQCDSSNANETVEGTTGSTVAEMLLPVETFGKIFILFNATGRNSPGFYIITAVDSNGTDVYLCRIAYGSEIKEHIYLNKSGEWVTRPGSFSVLQADQPVQVVYAQNSSCDLTSDGDPSLLMMVPVELFYYIYFCVIPFIPIRHYMVLVVKSELISSIRSIYSRELPFLG
uniref:IgGFc-binding protein N-terminal domain-containing protein n=1 Tax=Biomphalaria glabrata TaxID=6526 RepID=A0A2C9LBM9_BIOGL